MFTKLSAIYSIFPFQRAIANLSYYLPFKMASSGYQTLCHVELPVSGISKSLPHSIVNHQGDCGTASHCSVLSWEVLFWTNSCQKGTYLLRSLIFPCTNIPYVNTPIKHNFIYPVLWSIEASIKMFIDIEWMNKYWSWKWSSCLHWGTEEEHGRDAPLQVFWQKDEILFHQEILFIEEPRRYVKEDSGKGQVSF